MGGEAYDPGKPVAPRGAAGERGHPSDGWFYAVTSVLSVAALGFIGYVLLFRERSAGAGHDLDFLPAVNAGLNTLSATLLCAGYGAIRRGAARVHKLCMGSALVSSALFLACYLIYHYAHGDTKFAGTRLRALYFVVLISHIVLSCAVPPLALTTVYLALRGSVARHKRLARVALPIWLYVSVTGVVIYFMLRAGASGAL
jgi:putative membrane protein